MPIPHHAHMLLSPTLSSLASGGGQPGGMGRRRRSTPTAKMTCSGDSHSSQA